MGGHEPAMMVSLKPVRDQVMVVTGASSGISSSRHGLFRHVAEKPDVMSAARRYVLEIASSEIVPVR
jgi:NADP-dependent 3-hydroxy acid dehydrogenase YdfG